MARSLFLPVSLVAIAILCACVVPQQEASTLAPTPTRVSCAGSDMFLNKIYVLPLPFFPNPNDVSYQAPVGTTRITNKNILDDLAGAFCHANSRTQNDLLGLTEVFINPCTEADPSACGKPNPAHCDPNKCSGVTPAVSAGNSWGYRDPSCGTYIAISAGLWQGGANALSLDQYEKYRIQAELKALAAQYHNPPPNQNDLPIFDKTDPPNDSAMSVLAALAHERGHVKWWEIFVPMPAGPYVPNNFCNNVFYPIGLWNKPIDVPSGRWIAFAQIDPSYINPGSDVDNLGKNLGVHDTTALKSLDNIYGYKFWASALAAFSPDEEFVEAYQMSALANGKVKLKSLEAVIPGQNKRDLAATLDPMNASFDKYSALYNQTQCF